jgi:hypothetical protein
MLCRCAAGTALTPSDTVHDRIHSAFYLWGAKAVKITNSFPLRATHGGRFGPALKDVQSILKNLRRAQKGDLLNDRARHTALVCEHLIQRTVRNRQREVVQWPGRVLYHDKRPGGICAC